MDFIKQMKEHVLGIHHSHADTEENQGKLTIKMRSNEQTTLVGIAVPVNYGYIFHCTSFISGRITTRRKSEFRNWFLFREKWLFWICEAKFQLKIMKLNLLNARMFSFSSIR